MAIESFGSVAPGNGPALRQVSFPVHLKVYDTMAQRAAVMNVRPAEYARRLFEAAYAVRCAQEKGERHDDGELDMHVRLVFLMADCELDFIAEALGIGEATVARILEGWRIAAGEIERPAAVPPPAPSAKPAPAKGGKLPRWTDEDRRTLKQMWAAGKEVAEIAAVLGRAATAVQQYAISHRDLCPKRR